MASKVACVWTDNQSSGNSLLDLLPKNQIWSKILCVTQRANVPQSEVTYTSDDRINYVRVDILNASVDEIVAELTEAGGEVITDAFCYTSNVDATATQLDNNEFNNVLHHKAPDITNKVVGKPLVCHSLMRRRTGSNVRSSVVTNQEEPLGNCIGCVDLTPDQFEIEIAAVDNDESPFKRLNFIDRFLAIWILLAMALGIILGNFVPNTHVILTSAQFVHVSVPIAIGLLVMMYPILCRVRYETLHRLLFLRRLWVQIGISFFINWIVAPLFMLGLSWAFLPDQRGHREGLILVGLARCIAMVLIWTDLSGGDGDYCAILVAFNSILQIVLYAPMALLFINEIGPQGGGITSVNYSIVASSVGVFLGIPLAAAIVTRLIMRLVAGDSWYERRFLPVIGPFSLIGLLFTIIILFASQGAQVVHQITSVLRVAAPLIVYFIVMFFTTMYACRKMSFGYRLVVTQSFTAASNNFELAIAVAIATYGINSDQALAATVGPLIEVPVLVVLVYVTRFLRKKFQWEPDL